MYDTREKLIWFCDTARGYLTAEAERRTDYRIASVNVSAHYNSIVTLRKIEVQTEFTHIPGRFMYNEQGQPVSINIITNIDKRVYDAVVSVDGAFTAKRVIDTAVEKLEHDIAHGLIKGLVISNA